jgi:hypothetical protein
MPVPLLFLMGNARAARGQKIIISGLKISSK